MSEAATVDEAFVDQQAQAHGNRSLVVLLFDQALLGSMSFAFGVFDIAAHYGGLPGVDVKVVGGAPGTTIVGGGLTCTVPFDLDAVRDADLILVPNLPQPSAENPPPAALAALRTARDRGARIAGLCSGTFVLAAAGLLDGLTATTHWAVAPRLAELHPKVRVDPAALYIDHGEVLTAGGGAAGIDVGLHLIRAMAGAAAANRLARAMVVAPHRSGGQAQYIEHPVPPADAEDPVVESMAWARTQLGIPLPVSLLAERAHMSRRNYDRRFRELTGAAPASWLNHQRIIRAQQLLESTELGVDEIARMCGFSAAAALRPHFRRLVGVSMAEYRQTFTR